MLTWRGTLTLLALVAGSVAAQTRDIVVDVGVGGEIVAGAWNPLRVTLRDQPPAQLFVDIDQGSLREGERWLRYRAELAGGGGISVFEDELFIPVWRSFQWSVRAGEQILASGSFDRHLVDERPLELILSTQPGAFHAYFDAQARLVDVTPHDLPERAAAFDGVRTLLIDGSTAPPRSEAVLAASAAGVRTVLLEPLPSSFAELQALASPATQRLGAGWLLKRSEAGLADALALPRLNSYDITLALDLPTLTSLPPPLPTITLAIGVGGYLLATLLLVGYGGLPGLLTSLALMPLASLGAWQVLRPSEASQQRSHTLTLSGGELALRLELIGLAQLPAATRTVSGHARPTAAPNYLQTPLALELPMERWSMTRLVARPRLGTPTLQWEGELLVNRGRTAIEEVYVLGLGPQGRLSAGEERLVVRQEDAPLPLLYQQLAARLPQGSAIGRSGDQLHVALPNSGGGS
jgi:hypothetical protein